MKNIFSLFVATVVLAACNDKQESSPLQDAPIADVIQLTKTQYEGAHIALGKLERRAVASHINASGKLDVPPQHMINVSAPLGGYVKMTTLLEGMSVKKGDVLAVLQNQEYIQLQQDFLDNSSKLDLLEKEYFRQQQLARENVNAQKILEQAQAQFASMKAIVEGLRAKLSMIGIPPSSVNSGEIKSTIELRSPINGFVTAVNVSIGQFVSATDVLFKIVNMEHLHVELRVFEKDINRISVGQRVSFRLGVDTVLYQAKVHLVGKEIRGDRTVSVHCHLLNRNASLLPGMFVTAEIDMLPELRVIVPTTSLASYGGKDFIFVVSGDKQFRAIQVESRETIHDMVEIELGGKLDPGATIVTRGAFELLGLLKNKQD